MQFHTATIVEESGIMWIIGGHGNDEGAVYALDLANMKWRKMNKRYKRYFHSANLIGNDKIYLIAGVNP